MQAQLHFTVMVDPTPLLDGSGNCYQRHVVDVFTDNTFAGVFIAHSMSEALYIGERWIRIRQVDEAIQQEEIRLKLEQMTTIIS